ncbi:uncharacterized protein TNCV_651551 [Trichonephila clavipes]|nr:uncharacterized protein TNCV_651551 [Trichonephila clavipes]
MYYIGRWAVGSLVVRASDSKPEGLGSMLDVTKYPPSAHGFTCRNCGGGDRGRVAIYRPFGEVSLSLNRTVTCMVLKANDRRNSCPCHDEFRGPRSDYVRQLIKCLGVPLGIDGYGQLLNLHDGNFETVCDVAIVFTSISHDCSINVCNQLLRHNFVHLTGLRQISCLMSAIPNHSRLSPRCGLRHTRVILHSPHSTKNIAGLHLTVLKTLLTEPF